MTLQEALSKIHAPKGMTTLIACMLNGEAAPLQWQNAVGATLAEARKKLAAAQQAQANCRSDYAYWGYQGDVSYWRAATNLLEAAELVGADQLPDVAAPRTGGVVMDVCSYVEQFGAEVLRRSRLIRNAHESEKVP